MKATLHTLCCTLICDRLKTNPGRLAICLLGALLTATACGTESEPAAPAEDPPSATTPSLMPFLQWEPSSFVAQREESDFDEWVGEEEADEFDELESEDQAALVCNCQHHDDDEDDEDDSEDDEDDDDDTPYIPRPDAQFPYTD